MPYSPEYLRALTTVLNRAPVPKPRRDPPGIRVAVWASDAFICRRRLGLQFMEYIPATDEYPCGSCPFRSFCPTDPNRVPLARSLPPPEEVTVAEAALADAAQWLAPGCDSLAVAATAVGRVQADGVGAPPAWRPDAVWDATRLGEILAAYGFGHVPADPISAERLVRDGYLPASALVGAKRPGRPDQIVLRV